jgi:carbon monoxide dehydrogenase subunit G
MEFRVEAAIPCAASEVWAVLVDIPKIAGCIPGCEDVQERTRLVDYSAVLKQKLGPFKIALPANIAVQEVREPNWIRALVSGTEKFTGTRIDVTLSMNLRDTEPGHSHMVAECEMQVAGKLASLGYSVIKKKAAENFAEFRTRLLKVLEKCPVLQVQGVVADECVQVVVETPHVEALADALVKAAAVVAVDASVEAPHKKAVETGPEPAVAPATQT